MPFRYRMKECLSSHLVCHILSTFFLLAVCKNECYNPNVPRCFLLIVITPQQFTNANDFILRIPHAFYPFNETSSCHHFIIAAVNFTILTITHVFKNLFEMHPPYTYELPPYRMKKSEVWNIKDTVIMWHSYRLLFIVIQLIYLIISKIAAVQNVWLDYKIPPR